MGTINYGTSPIITLGTPTEYFSDYREEAEQIAAGDPAKLAAELNVKELLSA